MRPATFSKAGIVALLAGCTPPTATPGWSPVDSPARATALAPRLTSSDGELLLTWIEAGADPGNFRLLVSRFDGERFAPAERVHEGARLFVNWADLPGAVVFAGGERFAWWLEHLEGSAHAYGVRTARSAAAGEPWIAGDWLHRDRAEAEHGFVSVVAANARAFWLDGRDVGTTGDTALRARRVGGAFGRELVLDPRVCECCSTEAAFTHEGPIVAYRDRSANEVRDVAVVRETFEGFSAPLIVHEDGWALEGCPVQGPAIDADPDGSRVAVAWFTAAGERPRVQVALSADSARSFAAAIVVDEEGPLGRVGIARDGAGGAWVSWVGASTGAAAEVRVVRVGAGGDLGTHEVVGVTSAARAGGAPRLLRHEGSLWLAWIEPEATGPNRLRISRRAAGG